MKARTFTRLSCDDGPVWRVVDDLAHGCSVSPAELDAIEAFLMPLVHALLSGRSDTLAEKITPQTAQAPSPTHNRRNELLPEEI
jgi:hypothetical protein